MQKYEHKIKPSEKNTRRQWYRSDPGNDAVKFYSQAVPRGYWVVYFAVFLRQPSMTQQQVLLVDRSTSELLKDNISGSATNPHTSKQTTENKQKERNLA